MTSLRVILSELSLHNSNAYYDLDEGEYLQSRTMVSLMVQSKSVLVSIFLEFIGYLLKELRFILTFIYQVTFFLRKCRNNLYCRPQNSLFVAFNVAFWTTCWAKKHMVNKKYLPTMAKIHLTILYVRFICDTWISEH